MTQGKETKPRKKRVTKKDRTYMENYKAEAQKLYVLSGFATQQLLGERPPGDPRVEYIAGLEAFKNLANAQISALTHLIQELIGDNEHFREVLQRELSRQVESMEEEFCVAGWKNGAPTFNREALAEKIKGWPVPQ